MRYDAMMKIGVEMSAKLRKARGYTDSDAEIMWAVVLDTTDRTVREAALHNLMLMVAKDAAISTVESIFVALSEACATHDEDVN